MSGSGILSASDEAFITALAAWAGAEAPAFLLRLGHQQAQRLAVAKRTIALDDPLVKLKHSHRAQMAPDPIHVHPSWYVRALQDESPAIRLSVVAASDEPLRSLLIRELAIDNSALMPDHRPDSEVKQLALSLWIERLVGDVPNRLDDPPAIVALVNLSRAQLYRLNRLIGLAKLSTLSDQTRTRTGKRDRALLQSFRDRLDGPQDHRLEALARNDWKVSQTFGRHALASLGLTTMGRLLGKAEPYRLRWALQHIPYPIAKRIRIAANQPPALVRAVIEWEARFLFEAQQEVDAARQDEPGIGSEWSATS